MATETPEEKKQSQNAWTDLVEGAATEGTVINTPDPQVQYGVKDSIYDDNYITRMGDQAEHRADEQSGFAKVRNRMGRLIPSVGLEALELAGFIGDSPSNIAGAIGAIETDYDNWLSKWAREKQEDLRGWAPVYRGKSDKVFDLGDSGWWIDNIFDTGESILGFMATGGVMGAGLKAVGKGVAKGVQKAGASVLRKNMAKEGLKQARSIVKAGQMSEKALVNPYVNSLLTAQSTAGLNAAQTFKDITDYMTINYPEMTQEEIKEVAANNAANTYSITAIASTALNVTSLSPFTRTSRAGQSIKSYTQTIRDILKDPTKIKQGAKAYDWASTKGKLAEMGIEGFQEGIEEVVENYASHVGFKGAREGKSVLC
jgi:hypothetical protein